MIGAWNKNVACEPVASRAPETTAVGAGDRKFNLISSRNKLVPLKVLYGDGKIQEGDLVYLTHAEAAALKPVELERPSGSIQIVLVDTDIVKLVERPSWSAEEE